MVDNDKSEAIRSPKPYHPCVSAATSCRYDINGFVEELPQLPENRIAHSCAALPATGVRLVGFPNPLWKSVGEPD